MDLGATVCMPVSPRCEECPVISCCQAFREGVQTEIPLPKRRPEPTAVSQAMIAVKRGGRYLLRKSPPGERWHGLWEFLRVPLDGESGSKSTKRKSRKHDQPAAGKLEQAVAALCGLAVDSNADGFEFRHTVTRFRISLLCLTARFRSGTPRGPAEYRWARPVEFTNFAFSMPARKFADRLAANGSSQEVNRFMEQPAVLREEPRPELGLATPELPHSREPPPDLRQAQAEAGRAGSSPAGRRSQRAASGNG